MNQNNIAEKNNQQKLNKRLGYMCEIYFWFLCDIIPNIMKKLQYFENCNIFTYLNGTIKF